MGSGKFLSLKLQAIRVSYVYILLWTLKYIYAFSCGVGSNLGNCRRFDVGAGGGWGGGLVVNKH